MRQRTKPALLMGAVLAVTAAGCSAPESSPDSDAEFPMTVDNCGEDLVIESRPERVLTIGHSAVELLDAAGASDKITARAGEFGADLPDGLDTPPTDVDIIDPADPGAEKIIGSGADIVVGYGLFNAEPADLREMGVPNLVVHGECNHDDRVTEPVDFGTVIDDIERLAAVFGTEKAAEENVSAISSEIDALSGTAPGDRRSAAVVYYFSAAGDMSAQGTLHISNDVLDLAGFDNAFTDEANYVPSSLESLLDADPEVIVLSYGVYGEDFATARAKLLSEPGAEDLRAVRSGDIVGIPAADLAPDPGAVDGLASLLEQTKP
ncbi:ABC transporter substrate-binding protein [Salininema proteolyticum]|uniref:ABC transporter substrate-binding protein n=1 Tax=Salininema proteolyticum TaxID=1607685 RepID=A0ABV8TTT8_9ACTN